VKREEREASLGLLPREEKKTLRRGSILLLRKEEYLRREPLLLLFMLPFTTRFTVGLGMPPFHPFHCWARREEASFFPFHCWARREEASLGTWWYPPWVYAPCYTLDRCTLPYMPPLYMPDEYM